MASTEGPPNYEISIPATSDVASIQAAVSNMAYGLPTPPTEPADIVTESLYGNLVSKHEPKLSVGNITFQGTTILPSTTAGALEYNGSDIFFTKNATSGRGSIPNELIYSVSSNSLLSVTGSNQSIFPAITSGVPVESGKVYQFDGVSIVKNAAYVDAGSGTVTSTAVFNFGVPSISFGYVEYSYKNNGTSSTFSVGSDTLTSDIVNSSITSDAVSHSVSKTAVGQTNQYLYIRYRGFFKTSASGSFLPRIRLTTSLSGTVDGGSEAEILAGSYVKISKNPETSGLWV